MGLPRVYVDEPCPLEGYEGLSVRVLANATDREWKRWALATLGDPACAECAKIQPAPRGRKGVSHTPDAPPERVYCPACTAARAAWGESIALLYGPRLLDHDVSTPTAALALFDDDDSLPSEIVIWLQLVPSVVRERRTETLTGNYLGSVMTPSTPPKSSQS